MYNNQYLVNKLQSGDYNTKDVLAAAEYINELEVKLNAWEKWRIEAAATLKFCEEIRKEGSIR